jgi:hypothetical protein
LAMVPFCTSIANTGCVVPLTLVINAMIVFL